VRDKLKLLVVLQCAYATTQKRRKQLSNERIWLKALWSSHTGRMLKTMIPEHCLVYIINSSNHIGSASKAVFPPDVAHLKEKIEEIKPDVILACGRVAQKGMRAVGIPHIIAPHPAWRNLTKEHRQKVKGLIGGKSGS